MKSLSWIDYLRLLIMIVSATILMVLVVINLVPLWIFLVADCLFFGMTYMILEENGKKVEAES